MKKINVLVVDDHDLICMAVKQLFSKEPDIVLAGFARTGKESLDLFSQLSPEIVIIDIALPDMDGIELMVSMLKKKPKTKIILHSSITDSETIVKGFEAGAMGYVPKNFKPKQLIEAIHSVNKGEHYSKGIVSDALIDNYLKNKSKNSNGVRLTAREKEILVALTKGLTNQQIAEHFKISVRTVEAHKANIMKKLKLFSTAELVIYAIKHNIVTI
ncbi:MAG: response regulator transcription factor [Bacteroidetes bacterium]|nr:response regulator transcription factor [Bacteroidota bacterium]